MTLSPLIVVSLEGLATSALSCYGSSWNQTPTIDRLASTGCVWDRFLATSDQPSAVLAQWTAASSEWANQVRSTLGPIVSITDGDSTQWDDVCFDEVLSLPAEPVGPDSLPAEEIVDTAFGRLVAAAIERDACGQPWGVLWLHSRFLARCWDAPRALILPEEEFSDSFIYGEEFEGDVDQPDAEGTTSQENEMPFPPSHFTSTVPPWITLNESSHPDLVTAWMRTYGCQVQLVDVLLDILLQTTQVKNPSVMLVGTSGFRLGQGGVIGHRNGPLRSPDVHLPLVINRGGPLHVPHLTPSVRLGSVIQRLVEDPSLICSPSEWCVQAKPSSRLEIDSNRAVAAVDDANWFYVKDGDQSEHLFLKPDDIDDFNDVGRLRGDVIESLRQDTKNGPSDH